MLYCALKNNYIHMNRGDSFALELPLEYREGDRVLNYTVVPSDILYVGITTPNQPFEVATIRKKLSENETTANFKLVLDPEDTVSLTPGKYFLTAKLVQDQKVSTVLDQKEFWIDGTPVGGGLHG